MPDPARANDRLRADALAIWQAAVAAVQSERLVREQVRVEGRTLWIGGAEFDLDAIDRIAVVGAGKAGAGMAQGLEAALGPALMQEKQLAGWINVPADCLRPLQRIHLHAARPAGRNEPTAEGLAGSRAILRLVESLGPGDLALCLLSGGGSALLPAPVDAISLAEKQALTRHLSGAGANIRELNTVRKQLSQIKGGRLAQRCRAGHLVTLIISDVLGDPLDLIASGPTVPDASTPAAALAILDRFGVRAAGVAPGIVAYLEACSRAAPGHAPAPPACPVTNLVIGNNAVAVDAGGIEAERRGYSHAMLAARDSEPAAEEVGRHLARMALRMRAERGPDALLTGGEPIVTLAPPEIRGRGGRNQQLVLAALVEILNLGATLDGLALLSGGTDGEDGPTDAAGALIDAGTPARMQAAGLDPADYLRRNDAYTFFQRLGDLIQTGPTHTNVCDVRVVTVGRIERPGP